MVMKRTRGRTLQRLRERVLRADPLCAACMAAGRIRPATDLDHIVPIFKGGTDDDENLQGLCAECHAEKTRADLGQQPRTQVGVDGVPIDGWHHWNG